MWQNNFDMITGLSCLSCLKLSVFSVPSVAIFFCAFATLCLSLKHLRYPLYPAPTGGSLRQAQDRLCLPAGKHASILTYFQTKVNKKDGQKKHFFTWFIPFFQGFVGYKPLTPFREGLQKAIDWYRDNLL